MDVSVQTGPPEVLRSGDPRLSCLSRALGGRAGPCTCDPQLAVPRPGLFFFTFLFYSLSLAAVALMFVYYTHPGACHEGKIFISLNLTFCVCVSIVAVLPKVQVS